MEGPRDGDEDGPSVAEPSGEGQVVRGKTDKAPIRPHEALGCLNMYEREATEASLARVRTCGAGAVSGGGNARGRGPAGSLLRETRLALVVQW